MSEATVVNTPGYFYAVSYCAALFTLLRISNRKTGFSFRQGIIDLVTLAVITGFMILTADTPQALFLPTMAVVMFFVLFYVWISYRMTISEVVFYGIKCFLCGEMTASLAWQIYYQVVFLIPENLDLFWRIVILLLVAVVVTGGLAVLERYLIRDGRKLEITAREVPVSVLLFVMTYVISNLSYISSGTLFSAEAMRDVFIVRTLADMVGVAIFYAYTIFALDMQQQMEILTLQNIMDAQYKNYELSKESIDMVNQKYHDLKHQITLLKAEAGDQAVSELEQMEKEIKGYEAQNKTGNAVLDTVLTSKSMVCQSRGIELRSVVDGASLSFMNDMDISALFGNMLDNAIECEEKIPQPEKRLIRLNVVREKQFVRIRVENYCEEDVTFHDGLPQTTKKDKQMHGYGVKSMQSTVRRYGGSLVTSLKDHWFTVKILLPVPAAEGEA